MSIMGLIGGYVSKVFGRRLFDVSLISIAPNDNGLIVTLIVISVIYTRVTTGFPQKGLN